MTRRFTGLASVGAVLLIGACSSEPARTEVAADSEAGAPTVADESAVEEVAPSVGAIPAPAAAPQEIDGVTNKRLSFASGTSSARVESSITGYETVDYLLNARAGQAMNISMASPNTAAYFNLLEPGETEVAVFNGSMGENMFEGVAKKSGVYRIRTYLYRNAARRGEKAPLVLEVLVN